ncbi:MAG TPA: IS66 family transposase [Bacteroidales bacterium]|nr:IS66 family transposase [Bacteroidales bacterium]
MLFGAKRERFVSNTPLAQFPLPFDTEEITPTAPPAQVEHISDTREKSKTKPKHPGRLDFPAHLPVEEYVDHLPLHRQIERYKRKGPMKLLENFKGYLQTDGYSIYDWFAKKPGITHVGCMTHARRYFEKALSCDAEKAGQIMTLIQQLYVIEREAKEAGFTSDQRKELRLDKALPELNKLSERIAKYSKTALPKSPMGIAMAYTIQRWDNLLAYLYDGCLEIDNNLVENAIRPNALGRKNYLFAGSHDAAQRAAIFYSLFGTCKKNKVNPYLFV